MKGSEPREGSCLKPRVGGQGPSRWRVQRDGRFTDCVAPLGLNKNDEKIINFRQMRPKDFKTTLLLHAKAEKKGVPFHRKRKQQPSDFFDVD